MKDHDTETLENSHAIGEAHSTFRFTIVYYCKGCAAANFVESPPRAERMELRPCDRCGLVGRPPRKTRRCYPPPQLDQPTHCGPPPRNLPLELSFGRVLGVVLGAALMMMLLLSPLPRKLHEEVQKARQGKQAHPAAQQH